MLFAERVQGRLALRRGQSISSGERVLVIEDVITTGGSVKELIALVETSGAKVVGLGALLERGEDRDFGVAKNVILRIDATAWEEEDCPLCREGIELEAPGSRRTQ
jgi:orotate phosphoribosyltransferase